MAHNLLLDIFSVNYQNINRGTNIWKQGSISKIVIQVCHQYLALPKLMSKRNLQCFFPARLLDLRVIRTSRKLGLSDRPGIIWNLCGILTPCVRVTDSRVQQWMGCFWKGFLHPIFIAYNYMNAQFVLLSSPRRVCHKNPDDFSSYCISQTWSAGFL